MTLLKIPQLIFDTDMDTDCDDAGALSMICRAVQREQAQLLGVIADVANPYAAPCCESLCRHYGVDRPVGTIYADEYPESETDRYLAYRAHSASMGTRRYNHLFAQKLGKCDRDYPSAVRVYRQLLAGAADESVTIVCVGLLTALDQLLLSPRDDVSSLSGRELIQKKALRVVSMGYPALKGANFNWDMDAPGAQRFLRDCPVPVYVSGYGTSVITGAHLSSTLSEEHPLRQIYEIWNGGESRGRSSWDLIAVLYALEPDTPLLRAIPRGTCLYEARVRSYWASGDRTDFEIVPAADDDTLVQALNARMICAQSAAND